MTSSAKRDKAVPRAAFYGASHGANRNSEQGPSLDRMIQAQIGDKLRAMYGELADQPIPDRLTQVLAKLGQESKA